MIARHAQGTSVPEVLRRTFGAALLALSLAGAALAQDEGRAEPYAFEVEAINEGLPRVDPPPRLDTPRAALESFLDAIYADDLMKAAQILNLSAVPADEQAERGPDLALMLAFLLLHHNLIDWNEVPDQPDARVLPGRQDAPSPYSRRSIELGELQLDGRPVPISIQRFSTEDTRPVWLFSPFTVERIGRLYAATRPGLLSEWVPLRQRLDTLGKPSAREWSIVALTVIVCLLLWLTINGLMRLVARRIQQRRWAQWLRSASLPLATLLAALTFRLSIERLILLTGPVASNVDIASEVIALLAGAWLLTRTVAAVTLALSERYVVPLPSEDPENRRIKTSVYVVRRMTVVVIAVLSVGYILLRLGLFQTFGISVLASAGALGVVVAIAAQPLLGNMVAGLQIALSDPVRIGDVIMYKEHWATVEDIAFAHTVLRTDRDTRLVVPHAEFLAHAVENWSKEGEAVKRVVKLPVDYRIDVDRIRCEVSDLVDGDPRLTEPPKVEMVELTGDTAVLWIWLPAISPLASWNLQNEVREKLVGFLKEFEGGIYLPRQRHLVVSERVNEPRAP
ncbi:MAG: mechanosensitive ion channel family protein [Pseudomonadales bacterium]